MLRLRRLVMLPLLLSVTSLLHAVAVSGYVSNLATKQPIPGAFVKIGLIAAYTDRNGWYQLQVPPGNYNAAVSADGYLPLSRQVNITQDSRANFALSTAGVVRGTVIDRNRRPMPYAQVYLSGGQIPTTLTLYTNLFGSFQTASIPIGIYEAFAVMPGQPGPKTASFTQSFTLGTGEAHAISMLLLPTSTIFNIDQMPNWESCTRLQNGKVCAGGLGDAGYSMEQGIANPSLDGASSQFDIWGDVGYSNALFWKQLTPNDFATHFVFDWWVYIDRPELPQSLEFDLNQTVNQTKYIFGSQCNFKDSGKWDVWDGRTGKWMRSALPCPKFPAHTWNHFTWNLERLKGKVHYISLTINNVTYPVEMWEYPKSQVAARELNAAVQLDGDSGQDPYSIWVDEISITSW